MRVSTNQFYVQSLNRMLELQATARETQNQISLGRRVLTPGDDPVAVAAVQQINERVAAIRQFDRNGVQAEQRLTQVDDVMAGVSNVLQRVRELVIQGRSEALGLSDHRAIAAEVREQLDVLIDLGNSRNASGEYVFAGAAVATRPFTRDTLGNVSYNGDQVARRLQISETRAIEESFTGEQALFAVRNGNGTFVSARNPANTGTAQVSDNVIVDGAAYVAHDYRVVFTSATAYDIIDDTTSTTLATAQPYLSGSAITWNGMAVSVFGAPAAGDEFSVRPSEYQSMFTTFNDIARRLETGYANPSQRAGFGFDIDRAIENLDQAMEKVAELRATTGARLNTVSAQRATNEDANVNLQTLRSRLEDVDLTEAISILARETTALQAAQQSFVRVQGLTLFNFL
jgi:flagellar hook-associated protein 3 FlgL